jgi:hypothetical protein
VLKLLKWSEKLEQKVAPTILETNKLKIKVHANDHFPAHCHVELKDGREAVFEFDEGGNFKVSNYSRTLKVKDLQSLKKLCEAKKKDVEKRRYGRMGGSPWQRI